MCVEVEVEIRMNVDHRAVYKKGVLCGWQDMIGMGDASNAG